jgi:hypothetical protein
LRRGFEQGLVDRFYQGYLRPFDRWRLLFGKLPGVPVFRAASCLMEAFTPPSPTPQTRLSGGGMPIGGSG